MYSIKTVKKIFLIFVFLFLLWFATAATDLLRLNSFEKPIFAQPTVTADDGGSGTYKGFVCAGFGVCTGFCATGF